MKYPQLASAGIALILVLSLGSALLVSQEKGGGDETGPYDVVRGWPENYCGAGYVIGATAGILAERPDRVIIFSRGCLPVLEDTRGPAENFIPLRNAANYDLSQADAARHPRWDHIVNIVDRNGKLLFDWGTFGQFPGGFWGVHQFSVDSEGSLYTADVHVGRPQKFRPKPGANKSQLIGAPR